MNTYTLNFNPVLELNDEQFLQICQANPDLQLERTAYGELLIMSPTGGETGNRNAELIGELIIWNRQKQQGKVFDSSTGFKLPNGAIRSPDVAWIKQQRWEQLSATEKQKFLPIAPDFVIELRSETDSLKEVQDKLTEYMENGVKLGWLIDPIQKQVQIYRDQAPMEQLNHPKTISGEPLLTGFLLDLSLVWG